MTPSPGPTDSAQVRGQLVTSLELELIGPTQRVLKALAAAGQGLEREALDRLPSSWNFTGFLVPTTTDLSLRCDDTADDDLAVVDGVDQRRARSKDKAYKSGGAGDDGGPSDGGPAKPQFLPSSIGVSVFLPPGGELELIARWGDDTMVTEPSNSDPSGLSWKSDPGHRRGRSGPGRLRGQSSGALWGARGQVLRCTRGGELLQVDRQLAGPILELRAKGKGLGTKIRPMLHVLPLIPQMHHPKPHTMWSGIRLQQEAAYLCLQPESQSPDLGRK